MKRLKIVHESEIKDFLTSAKKQGYLENDFDFIEEDKTDYNNGDTFKIVGILKIKNLKTKQEKTYKIGHGSSWCVEALIGENKIL